MLGADVLVLQARGFGLRRMRRSGSCAARAARRRRRPAACDFEQRARLGRDIARGSSVILRRIDGTMPPSCSTRATSRCSGVISAWFSSRREVLRGHDRFLGLFGEFVQIHGSSIFTRRCSSWRRLRPVCRALRSVPRSSAVSCVGSWTSTRAYTSPLSSVLPTAGIPYPFRRNTWPFCVSARDPQPRRLAGDRRHFGLAAEHRGRHRQRHLHVEIAPLPLEERMRREPHAQVQISRRRAAGALFAFTADRGRASHRRRRRNAHIDGARVAVMLQRQPPRRAVIGILERQLDLVLDVAPLAADGCAHVSRRGRRSRRRRSRRRRTW